MTSDRADWVNKILSRPSEAGTDMGQSNDAFRSFKAESLARTAVQSLQNMTSQVEQHVGKKVFGIQFENSFRKTVKS